MNEIERAIQESGQGGLGGSECATPELVDVTMDLVRKAVEDGHALSSELFAAAAEVARVISAPDVPFDVEGAKEIIPAQGDGTPRGEKKTTKRRGTPMSVDSWFLQS